MDQTYLKKLYKTRELSDCIFIFPKDKVIQGHATVFAYASPVLRSIFLKFKKESNEGYLKIEMKDVELSVFEDFMKFVYCGSIDFDGQTETDLKSLEKLYIKFHKYEVESGKKQVFKIVERFNKNFYPNGIVTFLKLAHTLKDEDLFRKCTKKLLRIDYEAEFMNFSAKLLNRTLYHMRGLLKPCEILAIITTYISQNQNRFSSLVEEFTLALENIRWRIAEISDILGCSFLNNKQKVRYLIKNFELTSVPIIWCSKLKNVEFTTEFVTAKSCSPVRVPYSLRDKWDRNWNELTKDIIGNMGALFTNQKYTDCEFVFPNSQGTVKAHKLVLSHSSSVFETMFYGSLLQDGPIEIIDIEEDVFRLLLKVLYLQCEYIDLCHASSDTLYALYAAAHKYQCLKVLDLIRDFMINRRSHAFLFYELSLLYEDKILEKTCEEYLEDPLEALNTNYFLNASPEIVCSVYEANKVESNPKNMKQLVDGMNRYINKNQKKYQNIKFQVQRALKGIHFTKLHVYDMLRTSLLFDREKLIIFTSKKGFADLIAIPTTSELSRLSKEDQEIIEIFIENPYLVAKN